MEKNRREIPEAIQNILELDIYYTQKFVLWSSQFLPFRSFQTHYRILEMSCHAVPWFACWIGFMLTYTNESILQMQINMLIGMILEVAFVTILKAYVYRSRPLANTNDAFGPLDSDKFSFPSGHASQAAFIAYFFIKLYPLSLLKYLLLLAWATCVCVSRILLNRHHILDVVCGALLGVFVGWLLGWLWLSKEVCLWLWSTLYDDKF